MRSASDAAVVSRPPPGNWLLVAVAIALASCGSGEHKRAGSHASSPVAAAAPTDDRIPCATGTAALAPTCTYSREQTPAGLVVTIQRADGGFRRLLVTHDGRGIVAADGAQRARVTIAGPNEIEVALGGDRYRLPATIRAGAR